MNTQTFTITTSSFSFSSLILHPSAFLLLLVFLLLPHFCFAANTTDTNTSTGFTQADRERLIRLEATLETFMKATNIRFQELRDDMNRRFEAVDKRFEEMRADMNRRFEADDKRFEEMRADMNRRFEAVDKRFEDINKRFDDINKRFEQMYFFLEIICYTFAAIAIANFGFVFWDRRSLLRPLKQKVNKLEETHVSQEEFTSIKQQLTTVQTRLKNLEELYNNISSNHQTATI